VPNIVLRVNGQDRELPSVTNATLQFALRDDLGLTGTKYGCGVGTCGCCTVLIDGMPARSCLTQVQDVIGKEITTIEGLAPSDGSLHPLQQAWIEAQAPQCGYCQSGQIMEAVALLKANPVPTDQQIRDGLNSHICRCGTYNQIVAAVQLAAARMKGGA
jgi:isoquinoline 1-oxidoreductase subunit alpha